MPQCLFSSASNLTWIGLRTLEFQPCELGAARCDSAITRKELPLVHRLWQPHSDLHKTFHLHDLHVSFFPVVSSSGFRLALS
jgi:hypothetical protein